MILDKTALSELTQGALRWEWDAEGFGTPLRLTPEQTDFYSRTESDFSRARASAGVCLECHTDADALSFEYCLSPGSSRDLWGFDLYLGRRLFAHTEGTLSGPHAGVWKVPLPQGEKHLRLFLPNLAVTSLRDVELTGASYAHRPIHPRRLLCFGDSITQGYATHFPSMTLANLLGLKLDAALLNQGMAGEVFYGGSLQKLPDFPPDLILIAYGTNDWQSKTKSAFRRDAEAYLRTVRAFWPEAFAAVLTPIWRIDRDTPFTKGFLFPHVREILEEICESIPGMRVINGENLLPPVKELMEDRKVHPNELGFQIYAERVFQEISTAAQRKTDFPPGPPEQRNPLPAHTATLSVPPQDGSAAEPPLPYHP